MNTAALSSSRDLLAKGVIALCSIVGSSACAQSTLDLGLADYAELGNIGLRALPVLAELDLTGLGIQATIDWNNTLAPVTDGLLGQAIESTVTVDRFTDAIMPWLTFTASDQVGSSTSPFGLLNLTGIETGLSSFDTQIIALEAGLSDSIPEPDSEWYLAGATSLAARSQMETVRADAVTRLEELGMSAANVTEVQSKLSLFADRLMAGSNISYDVAGYIATLPGAYAVQDTVVNLVATSGDLAGLRAGQLATTRGRVDALTPLISTRQAELGTLVESIDYVLASGMLGSEWRTSVEPASLTGGVFAIRGSELSFSEAATEIVGPFSLGSVQFDNLVFPCPEVGACSFVTPGSFAGVATRTVDDPTLGEQTTIGVAQANFYYITIENVEGNPVASQDFVAIPSLGKYAWVPEELTVSFDVLASYNSPLRISGLASSDGQAGAVVDAPTLSDVSAMQDGDVVPGIGTGKVQVVSLVDTIASPTEKSFQLQDETGGITVFGSNSFIDGLLVGIEVGDYVIPVGFQKAKFNGLAEIVDGGGSGFGTSLLPTGESGGVSARMVGASDLQDYSEQAERLESTVVQLGSVRFLEEGVFAAGTNYVVTDGIAEATVRISTADIDLVGTRIPIGEISLTGVLSQFDSSNPAGGTAGRGYQLLLRNLSDVGVAVPEPTAASLIALLFFVGMFGFRNHTFVHSERLVAGDAMAAR
ncbi:hypothetical protein [Botrimarina mediterranea]|uniref:Uncharacterized protein n=1 Tax=Botrimarina mediterranea TaxID=2528022 RepID=A0A518K5Z8_9BACT|nr:hypothetical protein [Botrimarina mediterranea]QDV73211.1 hypothetical protein Spa11_14070 [Botrimarina mediterranea]